MGKKSLAIIPALFISFVATCQYGNGIATGKFDPSGQLRWEQHAGGYCGNTVDNICTDINSNVYVVGETRCSINFGETFINDGLFVAKYSKEGSQQWVQRIWGGGMQVEGAVADSAENLYVMGRSYTLIGSDTCSIEDTGQYPEIFVAKYNKYGSALWIKHLTGRDYWIKPEAISINEKFGHLYVIGWEDSLYASSTSTNKSKIIVAKFDLHELKVTKEITIAKFNLKINPKNVGNGIANDGSNLYICGSLCGINNTGNLYLAKLDTALHVVWEKQLIGSPSFQNTWYDLTLDDEKNVYATGYFNDSITIGGQTLYSKGLSDLLVAKYSASGEVLWAVNAGSVTGYYGEDAGISICSDNQNSIYVSGHVGPGTNFPINNQTEEEGTFFAKISKNGEFKFVRSFYTGFEGYDREGYVACDQSGNLLFTTHYVYPPFTLEAPITQLNMGRPLVYPNPCKTSFQVNFGGQPGFDYLRLSNLNGQTVKELANGGGGEVDVSGVVPGVYILSALKGKQQIREKLIIH